MSKEAAGRGGGGTRGVGWHRRQRSRRGQVSGRSRRGRIVGQSYLRQIEQPTLQSHGLGTGLGTICAVRVFTHRGATNSYMAEVAVNTDGTRVAVLLANGRTYNSSADYLPVQALNDLFCAA